MPLSPELMEQVRAEALDKQLTPQELLSESSGTVYSCPGFEGGGDCDFVSPTLAGVCPFHGQHVEPRCPLRPRRTSARYGRRTIEGQPLHRDPYAPGISKSERRKRLSSFRGDLAPGRGRGQRGTGGRGTGRGKRVDETRQAIPEGSRASSAASRSAARLLERAQGRAKRLGVELGCEVSRAQAIRLRQRLATQRQTKKHAGGSGRRDKRKQGAEISPVTTKVNEKPRAFARQLTDLGYSAVNPTQPGQPGAERGGRRYRLKADPESKKFVHVYGRGKKAERIWLRGNSPWQAGYQQKYGAQVKDLMKPGTKKRRKSSGGTRAPA